MALVVFCLAFGSINLLLYRIKNNALQIKQISIPAHIQISNDPSYKQLDKGQKAVADFLDSLASTDSGKKILDSLRQLRPGLMDSLAVLENKLSNHF